MIHDPRTGLAWQNNVLADFRETYMPLGGLQLPGFPKKLYNENTARLSQNYNICIYNSFPC